MVHTCTVEWRSKSRPERSVRFVCLFIVFILIFKIFFCGGRLQWLGWIQKDWEMSGIRVHDLKFLKNQLKII